MAFQPIWDIEKKEIFSQEALVRGTEGQGAGWVFERINAENLYKFDQACRVKAIETASKLKLACNLNINFLPNAVYKPDTCIRATLEASEQFNFPVNQIIFEVTETEKVRDEAHLLSIFNSYKKQGFMTAIDDFGAGYSGLKLLTRFVPDFIKIDMDIIRDIHSSQQKFFVTESIITMANKLGARVIAEGIESKEEYSTLRDMGIRYYQGYYFAKPAFEALGVVSGDF
ncbi:MAG: EAL domain-containing protein [Leptospira sp.]|nr:EAL domain-containing protein [Leptospira sp.]